MPYPWHGMVLIGPQILKDDHVVRCFATTAWPVNSWRTQRLTGEFLVTCLDVVRESEKAIPTSWTLKIWRYGGFRFVIEVPPVITHFRLGCSLINHPFSGHPPWRAGNFHGCCLFVGVRIKMSLRRRTSSRWCQALPCPRCGERIRALRREGIFQHQMHQMGRLN